MRVHLCETNFFLWESVFHGFDPRIKEILLQLRSILVISKAHGRNRQRPHRVHSLLKGFAFSMFSRFSSRPPRVHSLLKGTWKKPPKKSGIHLSICVRVLQSTKTYNLVIFRRNMDCFAIKENETSKDI